ncbi:MAG: hypothetical protein V3U03_05760 [Myxococcota bacterium]
MNSKRLRAALLAFVLLVAVQPGPARAEGNLGATGGMGALAALCSLVYGPIKIVYATGGLIFGSLAWALSGGDSEVLNAVLTPSVRGDYVVTPSHLRGDQPLEFIGRAPPPAYEGSASDPDW